MPRTKLPRQYESALQEATCRWIRLAHPKIIAYHIPNGGARDVRTGAALKRQGVLRGVPDWHIAKQCGGFAGLYVELKRIGEYPTAEQRAMHESLRDEGYFVVVCRTVEEFIAEVNSYLEL